jgi:hypothetical protein
MRISEIPGNLLFNNKLDFITSTDNPFQSGNSKPGRASKGDSFWQSFHVKELGIGLKHGIRDFHSLTKSQSLSWMRKRTCRARLSVHGLKHRTTSPHNLASLLNSEGNVLSVQCRSEEGPYK